MESLHNHEQEYFTNSIQQKKDLSAWYFSGPGLISIVPERKRRIGNTKRKKKEYYLLSYRVLYNSGMRPVTLYRIYLFELNCGHNT